MQRLPIVCIAEGLIANSSEPPTPYDPATVRSVVKWGTTSGAYSQTTEADNRLIYTYIYGPGEQSYEAWLFVPAPQRGSA